MADIKQNKFLLLYHCFLAILAVGIFFTATDIYLFDSGKFPPSYVTALALGFAATPLIPSFLSKNVKYLPFAILKWCLFYFVLTLIYYLLSIKNEIVKQEFNDRIFVVVYLLIMLFIFSGEAIVQKSARWAILAASFWNIYTYIYELFSPEVWVTLTTMNDSAGRAAGFYKNPNKAGLALVYSLVFAIQLLPKKYRLHFIIITFLGVLTTFSRGAIICTIILILLFFIKDVLYRHQLTYFFVVALCLILNLAVLGDYLKTEAVNLGISNYDIQTRIETFTNPSSRDASDDTSRTDIIGFALGKFWEKPLFGNGLAYDQQWEGEVRPHNMYLLYMVQHGVVGLFIVHLLAFSAIKSARGEIKKLGFFFLVLTSVSSFFSHTLFYNRESVMLFALMGVLSKQSYLNHLNSSGNQS
jgi:hypothetical protein